MNHDALKDVAKGCAEWRKLLDIQITCQGRMYFLHRVGKLVDGGRVQRDDIALGFRSRRTFSDKLTRSFPAP